MVVALARADVDYAGALKEEDLDARAGFARQWRGGPGEAAVGGRGVDEELDELAVVAGVGVRILRAWPKASRMGLLVRMCCSSECARA